MNDTATRALEEVMSANPGEDIGPPGCHPRGRQQQPAVLKEPHRATQGKSNPIRNQWLSEGGLHNKEVGMKSRKNSRARMGAPDPLTELINRVPGGHPIYKSGVDEGLAWAATTGPREVAEYAALRHEDVAVHVESEVGAPGWVTVITSFPGRFGPPDAYDGGLPDASVSDDEERTRLYWVGWLDGVHEAEARATLAPLLSATPEPAILVMNPPLPEEYPVCWIERNLGVRVVIKGAEGMENH